MNESFDSNVQHLQRQFLESLPQKAHQLEDLWRHLRYLRWSEQGFKTFQQLAHRLVGSGATFGIPEVSQTAQLLDQYLQDYQELGQPIGGIEFEMIDQMVNALGRTLANAGKSNRPNEIAEPEKTGAGKHIFLVETDHALSALMTVYLHQAGFSVHHFNSANACIQHLNLQTPHAILIDPNIANENLFGFDAIHQIKDRLENNVPIIFLSARSDMHTRLRALRAGCAAYITKPIEFSSLVRTLIHIIKTSEITHKVMIVDDEELVANYHAEILRNAGMDVICVTKPMQSLQRATEFKPDLVVLDMHMPDINGMELATLLRQNEQFLLLPIIFVTDDTSTKLHRSMEGLGVNGILTKPVDMDALVNACERAISDTFILKHRIESITQRARHSNQINRSYFYAAIDNELQAERSHQTPTALYYVALDIEENFYQEVGPSGTAKLHEQFCQRLAQVIGSEEQWSDIANFVACVLVGKRTRAQHQQRVTQIIEHLSGLTYNIDDAIFILNTHIGIHYLDAEKGTANTALAHAEQAYERTKLIASPQTQIIDNEEISDEEIAASTSAITIGERLPEQNLRICYQPMISLERSQIEHYEALVRWKIDDKELIPAAKFLHYLKHSSMRIELDRWVLQSAITAITIDNYARENASLFIHLSDETLAQKSFFSFVANVLRSSRLRGQRRLIFIFDEPWVAQHPADTRSIVNALRNIECGICLSHAGSTPASVEIINTLGFNYVRLAPSLTSNLINDSEQERQLAKLVGAAKNSGAEVIATQVEDSKNLSTLWLNGIRLFQGFLLQSPDQSIHSHKDLDILKQIFSPNE
jgi:DNA-binding response OmpR family regulator/EAL domain-containing protein (putative c-di-GMP-specific phosphodiesterase class I)